MFPKLLVFLVPIFFSFDFVASSNFEVVGVSALNPQNDPIYDPVTGLWSLDVNKDPVYEPSLQVDTNSPWSFNSHERSFSPYSNFNYSFSSPSSIESDSLSPTTTQDNNSVASELVETIEPVYTPKCCRAQKPIWYIKIGNIFEGNSPTTGLISRLKFFKDFINEASIHPFDVTYSIVSHLFMEHKELIKSVTNSVHAELYYVRRKDALEALARMGNILDRTLYKKHIIAITLSFASFGQAQIKIIFESSKLISSTATRNQLLEIFPNISKFKLNPLLK